MNTWSAGLRGKLIDVAAFLAAVGIMYAALAVGVAALKAPVPLPGLDLLLVGHVIWRARHGIDSIGPLVRTVRAWRRDREDRARDGVFERYGIYRVGSPPSHAAGRL